LSGKSGRSPPLSLSVADDAALEAAWHAVTAHPEVVVHAPLASKHTAFGCFDIAIRAIVSANPRAGFPK